MKSFKGLHAAVFAAAMMGLAQSTDRSLGMQTSIVERRNLPGERMTGKGKPKTKARRSTNRFLPHISLNNNPGRFKTATTFHRRDGLSF